MKRNLYISDLDGTLLNNFGELSEESKDKINKLTESDVLFTIASARSFVSIKRILKDIDLKLPIVEFNGGYITDLETEEHLLINDIEKDTYIEIFETIEKFNSIPLISTFKENDKLFLNRDKKLNKGMEDYLKDREENNDGEVFNYFNIYDLDEYKIMKFTLIDTEEKLTLLKIELEKIFSEIHIHIWEDMYYKPWYWLSIHPKKATKANGIKALINIKNIEYDKLIVFGDNVNDDEMFKLADEAFAVENAIDEIKNIATDVIGPNTSDSVVIKIMDIENI